MFLGGARELLGQSPTRNFSRLGPICRDGVEGLGEHLEKTWGVERERREVTSWEKWARDTRALGRAEDSPLILFRRGAVSLG